MNDVHLAGVPGEEVRLLDRRVAATNHGDHLLAEEGAVADGAVRDASTRKGQLTGNAELHRRAARGEDDGGRPVHFPGVGDSPESSVIRPVDPVDRRGY